MNQVMKKLLISLFLAGFTQSLTAVEKPNVVIFLVDDMGLMDTSVPFLTDDTGKPVKYPLNKWYRTPHMEKLASQGIRFSQFYAQSVCSPTRASIMTGQNATRHHTTQWIKPTVNNRGTNGPTDWNWKGLKKGQITLPLVMQSNGYRTIFVGKGHFGPNDSEGSEPINLGFDVNIAGCAIGRPNSYLGDYGQGTTHAVPGLEKYHNTGTFLTEAITLEANAEIKKSVAEKKPFFLYMSHYAVHGPFNEDPRFIGNYKEKSKQANAYAALVEGMDKSLGDIIKTLEEQGVAENTLIIFLGDNGSDAPLGSTTGHASSAPLRGKKATCYEGGMRAPFIAAWAKPNSDSAAQQALPIPANALNSQLATVMDVFPTVIDIARIASPNDHIIDGHNLKQMLGGKADNSHPGIFLMHFPHSHRSSYFTSYRKGDWKIIYHYFKKNHYELYNLKTDPYEKKNLAESNPEEVKILMDAMKKQLTAEDAQYPEKNGQAVLPQ